MTKSLTETIQMIEGLMEKMVFTDAVSVNRKLVLESIRTYLLEHGFPVSRRDRLMSSLVPFFFQEANYDDLEWSTQSADLRHLTLPFTLDAMVQSEGKNRGEMTPDEFSKYVELSRMAIAERTQAASNLDW